MRYGRSIPGGGDSTHRRMKGPAGGGADGASTGGRLRDFCLISEGGAQGTRYDMGLSRDGASHRP